MPDWCYEWLQSVNFKNFYIRILSFQHKTLLSVTFQEIQKFHACTQ